ncbi:hypothetical protein NC651_017538 [Populus alba x Populus x berolinensis]|nr:hypothetical protein NC651_017538 [Populus alba x Populus x berolinensis]
MEDSTVNDYAAGLTEDQSISRPMRLGILDDLLHSQGLIGDENTITIVSSFHELALRAASCSTFEYIIGEVFIIGSLSVFRGNEWPASPVFV